MLSEVLIRYTSVVLIGFHNVIKDTNWLQSSSVWSGTD